MWEEVKIPILTRVWKKLTPTFITDLEGLKTSVKEVTVNALRRRTEAKPRDATESLNLMSKS